MGTKNRGDTGDAKDRSNRRLAKGEIKSQRGPNSKGTEYHSEKTWTATARCACSATFNESSTVSQAAANDAARSAVEQHIQDKHRGPLTGK